MKGRKPIPGAEDLYPHVSLLDQPGNEMHGEMVLSLRATALLAAPSIEEFAAFWERHSERLTADGKVVRITLPAEWQKGARRHSKELQARYGCADMVGVLRGLHREHGVFSQAADRSEDTS